MKANFVIVQPVDTTPAATLCEVWLNKCDDGTLELRAKADEVDQVVATWRPNGRFAVAGWISPVIPIKKTDAPRNAVCVYVNYPSQAIPMTAGGKK